MILNIPWDLPSFIKTEVRDLLSADGQLYSLCSCGEETRLPPEFATSTAPHCRACGNRGSTRWTCHARHLALHCQGCGRPSLVTATTPARPQCPNPACGSRDVEERGSWIEPPFPRTFVDLLSGDRWGQDHLEDLQNIMQEMQPMAITPDWGPQMLLWVRFLQRLRQFSYQDDIHAQCMVLNAEANILRDYFKRTLVLEAGVLALQAFQSIVPLLRNPLEKAAIEHNVATAAYSLLARADHWLEVVLGDVDVRAVGRAAALSAIQGYASEDFDSKARDIGRVHHLLGDILAAGDASPESLHEAVEHYDQALQLLGGEPGLAVHVRVSRVNVQAKLEWPHGAETEAAVRDLQGLLAVPEAGRLWPQQHEPHYQLALYHFSRDEKQAAMAALQKAAALALGDIENAQDETSLHARTQDYQRIFSALSGSYSLQGQAQAALAAAEALRGASVRIHTLSDKARRARMAAFARRSMKQLLGGETSASAPRFKLPDIDPELAAIRKRMPKASVVALDFSPAGAALILDRRGSFLGLSRDRLTVDTWAPQNEDPKWLVEQLTRFRVDLMNTDSPSRERDLQQLLSGLYPRLIEPIHSRLREAGISQLLLITPGALQGLPIEVEPVSWAPGKVRLQRAPIGIRSVPSLGVAADLVSRPRNRNGKVLVVGYAGDDLDNAAAETEMFRMLFGSSATVLSGQALSKGAVLAELSRGYQYVHFCCHGSFDLLAPENSALHLSQDEDDDARNITAADLRRVDLQGTELVTLSACSTGAASMDLGNDIFGLTGSLLRAGACATVGSRWPVSDAYALAFMTQLYQRIRTGVAEPFSAFDAATSELSRNERLENWAAFAFVGV